MVRGDHVLTSTRSMKSISCFGINRFIHHILTTIRREVTPIRSSRIQVLDTVVSIDRLPLVLEITALEVEH